MSIIGLITDNGVLKSRQAENDSGFKILPSSFGVSRTKGPLNQSRTDANAGMWYQGLINSRVVVDYNTIKFVCIVPTEVFPPDQFDFIREMYIFCKDTNNDDFLFAIGQTTNDILYDPSGTVTLELEIALTNVDLSSILVFKYTQATEVLSHSNDPNAHPEIIAALNKGGLFLQTGGAAFAYAGQNFDEKPEWYGLRASATRSGITFTATHTGTPGNSIVLAFDGLKTTDQVRAAWNNAHPTNTVEHNGTGFEVQSAGSLTLTGGLYYIDDGALVYKDIDGYYKMGLADGTIRSRVVGTADRANRIVRGGGFISKTTSYAIGTELFLSDTIPGGFTDLATAIKVAIVVDATKIFLSSFGGGSGGLSASVDAIVSDRPGYKHYLTTQLAIDDVPTSSTILIDKMENMSSMINTSGKVLHFMFSGGDCGWSWYAGQSEVQRITFSPQPTSGTWRIEWNGQFTTDLAYNCSALDVQNAFNLLTGHSGVVVTGSYATYFTITYNTYTDYAVPTFLAGGLNEIQRFNFDNTPDDGTVQFRFNGENTIHIPWNSSTVEIESYLEDLSTVASISVTGSFAAKYLIIEFTGTDGYLDQPMITINDSSLEYLGNPVVVTPVITQNGRRPANNLLAAGNPVLISALTIFNGSPTGPDTCIQVTADGTRFSGYGKIIGFVNGIDLNSHKYVDVEMLFDGIAHPVLNVGLKPIIDYHVEKSFGIAKQVIRSVGIYGEYSTFDSAYSAANTGDKIEVLSDQTITSTLFLDKDIEIELKNDSKFRIASFISGTLITLADKIRTKNLRLSIESTGSFLTAFKFTGLKGHHSNIQLELGNAGTAVTNGFILDTGASTIFGEGVVSRGSSVLTNVVTNSSGYHNHNFVIRDKEFGTIHDVASALFKQETPVGLVNGTNRVFTLSLDPSYEEAITVTLDDSTKRLNDDWNYIGSNQIQFAVAPALGQSVYVKYWTYGTIRVPPNVKMLAGVDVTDNTAPIEASVTEFDFGSNISATKTATSKVRIDVTPGAGLGTLNTEYHTVTAFELLNKEFTLLHTPTALIMSMVDGGGLIKPNIDYAIAGVTFSWGGLGLDGIISEGDILAIAYFY